MTKISYTPASGTGTMRVAELIVKKSNRTWVQDWFNKKAESGKGSNKLRLSQAISVKLIENDIRLVVNKEISIEGDIGYYIPHLALAKKTTKAIKVKKQVEKIKKYKTKKIVFIDPGHGGSDAGATYPLQSSNPEMTEKEIVRKIAKQLYLKIKDNKNIVVYSTRVLNKDSHVKDFNKNDHVGYSPDGSAGNRGNQFESLDDRVAVSNSYAADLFISIHVNSVKDKGSVKGMESYIYKLDGTVPNASKIYASSKRFAENLKEKFEESKKYSFHGEFIRKSKKLNVLAQQKHASAILIETGFLSNLDDRTNFKDINYINGIGNDIAEVVNEFYAS